MNHGTPQVSVILPTRNRARLVARAVASVFAQSSADLELIVVDDASSDDTSAVLAAVTDPRLRVLRLASRVGAAAARNHGMGVARGAMLSFIDSDDRWHAHKLERQLAALASAPAATGLCVCSMEVFRAGKRHLVAYRDELLPPEDALRRLASGVGVGTPCWLVARDTMHAAGGFRNDLPRLQDYECALRLARRAPLFLMSDVLVSAEIGADSISADADGYARAIDIICAEHRDLFTANARGHSYLVFRAGKYFALSGRGREASRWFVRALRIRPWNLRALAGLVLCATGLFPLFRRLRYSA